MSVWRCHPQCNRRSIKAPKAEDNGANTDYRLQKRATPRNIRKDILDQVQVHLWQAQGTAERKAISGRWLARMLASDCSTCRRRGAEEKTRPNGIHPT